MYNYVAAPLIGVHEMHCRAEPNLRVHSNKLVGTAQRRCDKRAPGSAWGGACGYNLSHDQLSSVDQQYKTVILTKLGWASEIAGIRPRYYL